MVTCPNCQSTVEEEHVDRVVGAAECPACGEAFAPGEEVPAPRGDQEDGELDGRHSGENRPADSVEWRNDGDELRIELPWAPTPEWHRRAAAVTAIFAALVGLWWVFLRGLEGAPVFESFVSVVTLLAPLVAIAAYFAVVGFVNRTVILVDEEEFSARETPLPWSSRRSCPTEKLDRVALDVREYRTTDWQQAYYRIEAVDDAGQRYDVARVLDDYETAAFVEEQLEDFLGLPA